MNKEGVFEFLKQNPEMKNAFFDRMFVVMNGGNDAPRALLPAPDPAPAPAPALQGAIAPPAAAPAAAAAPHVPAAAPAVREEPQAPAEREDEEPNKRGRPRKQSKKAELAAVEKPARPARKPLLPPSPSQQQAGSGRHRERNEAGHFVSKKGKKKASAKARKPTAAPRPPPSRKTPSRGPPRQSLAKEATSSVSSPNSTRPGPKERRLLPGIITRWKRLNDAPATLKFVRETSRLSLRDRGAVEQSLEVYHDTGFISCKMSLIKLYDAEMTNALKVTSEAVDFDDVDEDKADDDEQDEPESEFVEESENDSSYSSGNNTRKRRKSRKAQDESARKRVPRESSLHALEGTPSGLTQDDPNELQENEFARQGVVTTSTSHGDAAA